MRDKKRDQQMSSSLSIVIANYNYGRFLPAAIESILSQCDAPRVVDGRAILPVKGTDMYVELIICDAASTDDSKEILSRYQSSLAWWCSEPDGGQSAAFNKGFSHAKGEWLTWLNADEIYCANVFAELSKFILRHPKARWIAANDCLFEDKTRLITHVGWGPHLSWPFFIGRRAIAAVFGPSSFFRRELFEAVGGFDERFHFSMDCDLWTRFVMRGVRQYRLNKTCWKCRIQENSKTFGAQRDKTREQRQKEILWMASRSPGYDYRISIRNVWYLLWLFLRIVDLSIFVRIGKRLILTGKPIEAVP